MSVEDFEITDFSYITSAVGNAYFSGISFDQLWYCVSLSKNREELDEAVTATIRLKEIVNGRHGCTIRTDKS